MTIWRKNIKGSASFVATENQSRGSAVIRHGTLFFNAPIYVVRRRSSGKDRMKGLSGVHSSYLRCGCCRARSSGWLFTPGGPFLLERWLLFAHSTWLIAGVTLAPARFTFGIKWQRSRIASGPHVSKRARRESGRKFRSPEYKSWLQIAPVTYRAEASARIFQPRAARFLFVRGGRTLRAIMHHFSTLIDFTWTPREQKNDRDICCERG